MQTSYKIPLSVAAIICVEILIYLWAAYTTETEVTFAKCARNSGRASAGINLILLLSVGYFGLKTIYNDALKRDLFRILITAFAVNHLIHFFYITQSFEAAAKILNPVDHIHGVITFVFILIMPVIVWAVKRLNKALYIGLILHLFNTTYFMIDTFYNKIINDPRPAYLHQIGIGIMVIAMLYILYRVYDERKVTQV